MITSIFKRVEVFQPYNIPIQQLIISQPENKDKESLEEDQEHPQNDTASTSGDYEKEKNSEFFNLNDRLNNYYEEKYLKNKKNENNYNKNNKTTSPVISKYTQNIYNPLSSTSYFSQRFNNTFMKTIKNCISATSFIAPEIHPAAHDIEFNKAGFILFCCFAISNCSLILECNKFCVLNGSI